MAAAALASSTRFVELDVTAWTINTVPAMARDISPSATFDVSVAPPRRVRTVHATSRQTYGAPRVHAALRASGERHGRKRIARLMRGASHCDGGPVTTRGDGTSRPAPDLVDRDFTADRPNRLRVADITFIPTAARFLYVAVVLDAWSRKVVGWATANHLRTELVLDALEMAVGQRRPRDVIRHSDQGSQYTSLAFGKRSREAGVQPSMGSVGDAYDNALCGSFFATLECELLARRGFAPHAEACIAVLSDAEGWNNPARLHSALGDRSHMTYEEEQQQAAAPEPWSLKPRNHPRDRGKPKPTRILHRAI